MEAKNNMTISNSSSIRHFLRRLHHLKKFHFLFFRLSFSNMLEVLAIVETVPHIVALAQSVSINALQPLSIDMFN
jgi:hypothetical protein